MPILTPLSNLFPKTEVFIMKEFFFDSEIEVIRFPQSDIITTSGGLVDGEDDNELPGIIFP